MRTLNKVVALVLVAMALSIAIATPAEAGLDTTCQGDGCTYLSAVRHGDDVTITAYGYSYTPGKYVWVQVNVYDAVTGKLLWRDMHRYTASSSGRTGTMTVFIDCAHPVRVQSWTWRAYSSTQPEAHTTA